FSCGRFETPPPPAPADQSDPLAAAVALYAKMFAGASLLNPIGAGLIGAGLGTAWGVPGFSAVGAGGPCGAGATPDQAAPDVTGAAGAEVGEAEKCAAPR